jgi:peptidoglycan/xylan/chitin deacetylase (PgdA/CDA1 family)
VTFDGGFLDNLESAAPILSEMEIPATFFVSGTPSEESREAWWDTLEHIFMTDERIPDRLRVDVIQVPMDVQTVTGPERRTALSALHERLRRCDDEQIRATVAAVAEWSGLELAVRNSHRLLTASELLELSERDHEIGTMARGAQLTQAKAALEELLGKPVNAVAYAYGQCELETTELAEQAGFATGCTSEADAVTPDSDPLRLPRIDVSGEVADAVEVRLEQLITDRL